MKYVVSIKPQLSYNFNLNVAKSQMVQSPSSSPTTKKDTKSQNCQNKQTLSRKEPEPNTNKSTATTISNEAHSEILKSYRNGPETVEPIFTDEKASLNKHH